MNHYDTIEHISETFHVSTARARNALDIALDNWNGTSATVKIYTANRFIDIPIPSDHRQ